MTASKKPHVSFFNNFYWSLVALQYGVSTVQQSESATYIHICPLFWISFPSRSPESTRVPWALRRFSLVLRVIHSISGVYIVYLKHSYTRASQVFPFPSKPTITNQIRKRGGGLFLSDLVRASKEGRLLPQRVRERPSEEHQCTLPRRVYTFTSYTCA